MILPVDPRQLASPETEDGDTIELELSGAQMLELSRRAAVAQPAPAHGPIDESSTTQAASVPVSRVRRGASRRGQRLAAVFGIALAASSVSGVAYLTATHRPPPPVANAPAAATAAPESPPPRSPTEDTPVRFTNPFDATEVFEFPAGTSATAAHDAVADLLLVRARERQIAATHITPRLKKRRPEDRPVAAISLAQHDAPAKD